MFGAVVSVMGVSLSSLVLTDSVLLFRRHETFEKKHLPLSCLSVDFRKQMDFTLRNCQFICQVLHFDFYAFGLFKILPHVFCDFRLSFGELNR